MVGDVGARAKVHRCEQDWRVWIVDAKTRVLLAADVEGVVEGVNAVGGTEWTHAHLEGRGVT